mgnify:CR=1 FL=1
MEINTDVDIQKLNDKINKESAVIDMLMLEMNKVIVGQKNMSEKLLVALLSNGHVLLEGVPGLAKTLAISTLAKTINAKFSRLQFTPDLLPADIIGNAIKDIIENQNPKTRYVFTKNKFKEYTLPGILSDRKLDKIMAKRLKIKKSN